MTQSVKSPSFNEALVVCFVLAAVGFGPAAEDASGAEPILDLPGVNSPLDFHVDLPEGVEVSNSGTTCLVEAGSPENRPIVQIVPSVTPEGLPAETRKALIGTLDPGSRIEKERRFRLAGKAEIRSAQEKAVDLEIKPINDTSIQISDGDVPVLVYNFGVITNQQVPESDHRRSRACYVHPIYGLDGEVLTDDFPRDHYHHHGLFWTWPHVQVDGKEHDLWAGNTIGQQFVRWLAQESGPAAAVLGVENGWFVGDEKVMIERVWLRVYHADDESRALDVDLTLIPNGKPVTLWGAAGKSYGGLTMRFAPPSAKDPATVITTPSGPVTKDLTETFLRWADFTSKLSGHESLSGAAIFVAPSHPDYPPMWLLRHYGPLCVGWPGTTPATLKPNVPVQLSYRIWIHEGKVSTSHLQRAYEAYLAARKGTWSTP